MSFRQAISDKLKREAVRIEKARSEFNFNSIQAQVKLGSKILDVGAWNCYLGELLRDRLNCEVLSLDVVNANKNEMPFRIFDGKTFPVESESFDAVLFLYVLHHAAEGGPILEEANRVLREDGFLMIAEDSVEGLWNKILTIWFHIRLFLTTGMPWRGKFLTAVQWTKRFREAGFEIKETIPLGHHLGRFFWPNNVLFVLRKS